MALSIPSRKKPGANSFPTSPDQVRQWLTQLHPLTAKSSIRSLYRGLKHSNRLNTTNLHRIAIAELLETAVYSVLNELYENFQEQSLPLLPRAARAHRTAAELLRELAYTHKIIVNDTYTSLLPGQSKERSHGIYRALRAMARQIECQLYVHAPVPTQVLYDANQLLEMALKSQLVHNVVSDDAHNLPRPWTIETAYILIQLLALAGTENQRQRQIPLICRLLADQAHRLTLTSATLDPMNAESTYAIHLGQDGRPEPVCYSKPVDADSVQLLDMQPLLEAIDTAIDRAPVNVTTVLEGDTLSQATLIELRESLWRTRPRRASRAITHRPISAVGGLRDIAALLRYTGTDVPSLIESTKQKPSANSVWPTSRSAGSANWHLINESMLGACLEWRHPGTTSVEVGDVVAFQVQGCSTVTDWSVGRVCWVRWLGEQHLQAGVEILADRAESLVVNTRRSSDSVSRQDCLKVHLTTDTARPPALIAPGQVLHDLETVSTSEPADYRLERLLATTPLYDIFELTRLDD